MVVIVATHRLPSQVFTALANGGGGAEAVRRLAAVRHSRNRLLLYLIVEQAQVYGPTTASIVREAYRTLVSLEKRAPQAVDFMLDYPAVSAWLLDTATQLHSGRIAATQPIRLAAVAAAAAVRASITATIDIPVQCRVDEELRLPTLGAARLPAGPIRVSTSPEVTVLAAGGARVAVPQAPEQAGPGWCGLPELSAEHAGLRLNLLVDRWEGRGELDQPGGPAVVGRHELGRHELGREEIGRWQAVLAAGWRLLATHHRASATEVAAVHTMLVPLRASATSQVSSTPNDAFGCVAMGRPADPRTAALTLAHEVQHAKLSVLADLVPLVDNTGGQTFYAPWRPDPRPPPALLQGIYAHLGITAFWRTQRQVEHNTIKTQVEFARWRTATQETALVLLDSGLLTPMGTEFVTNILDVLKGWESDTVSAAARTAANCLANRHRDRWWRR